MKKSLLLTTIFFCTLHLNGDGLTNTIHFEPNCFNNLKYDWNNYVWDETENDCCNQLSQINKISINLPSKIYQIQKKTISVPVCISYYITEKRIYKYNEKEYELSLNIKANGDKSGWLKYPLAKKEFIDYTIQEMMELPPNFEEETKEKALWAKQCKSLSDSELDDGYVYGGNITFNISDYIDFPLSQGKYEIFISRNNIESEHKIFEIIFDDKMEAERVKKGVKNGIRNK